MSEVAAGSRFGGLRIALVAGVGIVLGTGAHAWLKSRHGETALTDRTRARLVPAGRDVSDAADQPAGL